MFCVANWIELELVAANQLQLAISFLSYSSTPSSLYIFNWGKYGSQLNHVTGNTTSSSCLLYTTTTKQYTVQPSTETWIIDYNVS